MLMKFLLNISSKYFWKGINFTLTIIVQTVNMLVSLMVKIQKHARILLYGGTILKQIFKKINQLLTKLPTDTRTHESNSEPHYFPTITKQKPFTHEKPKLHMFGKCSFIFPSCLYFLFLEFLMTYL